MPDAPKHSALPPTHYTVEVGNLVRTFKTYEDAHDLYVMYRDANRSPSQVYLLAHYGPESIGN